jgi:hypothetical protein
MTAITEHGSQRVKGTKRTRPPFVDATCPFHAARAERAYEEPVWHHADGLLG